MSKITEYFKQAELSLAAYANLSGSTSYILSLKEAGMTQRQAEIFAAAWTVASQYTDPSTGLSATVFQENATGQKYLAIRGTEPSDFLRDIIINDGLIAIGALPGVLPQYSALKVQVTTWLGNGTLNSGFTVSGHSLGGYLATALTADFSANVTQTYLYNSPAVNGAGAAITAILEAFGIAAPINASKIINIKADAGISPIAGLGAQVAPPIAINIENQLLSGVSDPPGAYNHSMQVLTDSLALYQTFAKLYDSISISLIKSIFKAASNKNELTLEHGLDALRTLVLGNTAVNSAPTLETDRNSFFTNLYDLQNSATFQALIGKVNIEAAPTSGSAARTDLGDFLSLYYLTPFALHTTDAAAKDALYNVHADLAGLWNDDRNLTAEQIQNGEANFSDMYLADRAQMLKVVIEANKQDVERYVYIPNSNAYFKDLTTGIAFDTGNNRTSEITRDNYIFGSNEADAGTTAINGGDKNDHLYGMAGNDQINGGDGNDYIEGNAGQDTLKGESGNDILIGGIDVDILDGGTGNDQLKGGAGVDVYQFNGTYGIDIITDSDGQGFISIDNTPANSGTFKLENIYKNDSTGYTFTQVNGGTSIVISKEGDANRVIINDWSAGDLSINLTGSAPAAPQATLSGDFKKKIIDDGISSPHYQIENNNYVNDGDEAGALDLINGTAGNDVMDGIGGSDYLNGKAGDDYITGGTEGDYIQGGLGKDTLMGGAGDDKIYGSSDENIRMPSSVNFRPPTITFTHMQGTGFNWVSGYDDSDTYSNGTPDGYTSPAPRNRLADDQGNLIDGGAGNDFIVAGTGADYVHGGEDMDLIWGMDKADIIFGDAGNDYIYGDGNDNDGYTVVWTLAANHGNDIIDGGDGEDFIIGQGGDDILFGGTGDDKLWGDDPLYYTSLEGDDLLFGGAGNDQLVGGGGNDYLDGGENDDTLYGDAGNDTLIANSGNDGLAGGADNDTYIVNSTGVTNILDTQGENTIIFGASLNPDNLKLHLGSLLLDFGNGSQVHLQNFNQNDVFNSTSFSSFTFANGITLNINQLLARGFDLDGTTGDDMIEGTNTTDRINGYAGNDTLNGGAGNNTLIGGAGDDVFVVNSLDNVIIENYLEGVDTVNSSITYTLAANLENLTLTGALAINATGNASDNILIGNDAANILIGGAGEDIITGGIGNDTYTFSMGDGFDAIEDTQGLNQITFGAGIIRASVHVSQYQGDDGNYYLLVNYGAGTDKVAIKDGLAGGIQSYHFADGTVVSHADLIGDEGVPFHVYGTINNDTLVGTGSTDILEGKAGNDQLLGLDGDDKLLGGIGTDTLIGGAGNDLLNGGLGNDQLSGGAGQDSYLMSWGMGRDTAIETTSAEINTLKLNTGILISDLTYQKIGNDLNVYFQGSNEGVLIKNYYDGNQQWQIVDAQSIVTSVSDFIATPVANDLSTVQQLMTNYQLEMRAQYYSELGQAGYALGSDGKFTKTEYSAGGYSSRFDYHINEFVINSQQTNDSFITAFNNGTYNSGYIGGNYYSYTDYLKGYIAQYNLLSTTTTSTKVHSVSSSGYGNTASPAAGSGSNPIFIPNTGNVSDDVSSHSGHVGGPYLITQNGVWYFPPSTSGSSGSAPSSGISYINFTTTNYQALETQFFVKVQAGALDNEIYVQNQYVMVDAGAGNDLISAASAGDNHIGHDEPNFYSGLIQNAGTLLYGNAGDDHINGSKNNDILVGGKGDDYLDGKRGADTYYVFASDTGFDTINDSEYLRVGDEHGGTGYSDYYYRSLGITNWEDKSAQQFYAGAQGLLPALPVISALDYNALAPLYQAGVIEKDTVQFGAGINLADLNLSWGNNRTLNISWAEGRGVNIVMPVINPALVANENYSGGVHSIDQTWHLGAGIEQFKFADGTTLSMSQLISALNPLPSISPIVFELGMGNVVIPITWAYQMSFGNLIQQQDIVVSHDGNALVVRHINGTDQLKIEGWYANAENFDTEYTLIAEFQDGLTWSAEELSYFGKSLVQIANHDPIVANPIASQTTLEDGVFSFTVPANAFADVDVGDTLTYSTTLADGSALPSWLTFSATTRTFSGTPSNEQVGNISLKLTATDLAGASISQNFNLTVQNTNDAPTVANAITAQTATEDATFSYMIPANAFSDIDAGDTLSYSISLANGNPLPSWLTYNATTRTVSGIPTNSEVGSLSIEVTATDTAGASVTQSFSLNAKNTNDAPVVANSIAAQTALEDSAFTFTVPANAFADVDVGDTLSYTTTLADGSVLPSWLSFNALTLTFTGTPQNENVGILSLKITATDTAGATANQVFDLNVQNTNDAPTVSTIITAQTVLEDNILSFQVPANAFVDVDASDTLSYTATLANGNALPSWLSFNASTHTFSGTPLNGDVGNIGVKVIATDAAGASVNQSFILTVQNTNDAPIATNPIAAQTAHEDNVFIFTLPVNAFIDIDAGDTVIYTTTLADGSSLPSWLTFNATTRTISGTPTNSEVGSLSLTVTATDVAGVSASQNFDLTVQNTNDAPTLSVPLLDASTNESQAITYSIPANTFAM